MINIRKQFLDSDMIKGIAVLTMLIDHIGAALLLPMLSAASAESYEMWYGTYRTLREIGRTAFPIFAFLLVEGFFHTHNRKKYFGRLFLFALLSEIPFDMAFHGTMLYREDQNVFWTLAIGFGVIWAMEDLCRARKTAGFVILGIVLVPLGIAASVFLRVDYSAYGFLLILLFYLGKRAALPRALTCAGGYLLLLWEPYCLGGFLLILFYNGKRKPRGKGFQYFFYLFYPVHLLILGLFRVAFLRG